MRLYRKNSQKRAVLTISFLLVVVPLLVPETTHAVSNMVPCSGDDCDTCDLVQLGNSLVSWLIGLSVVLFGVLTMVAGLQLVTSRGNQGALQNAKDKFTSATVGFILVMAAWLIVDTIMKSLVSDGYTQSFGPWNTVACIEQTEVETAMDELLDDPSAPGAPPVANPIGNPASASDGLSEDEAQARLRANNIEMKGSAGFSGLQPHVIDEIVAMDRDCNCNILITEATAGTHAQGTYSHANGYKLDLRRRDNPELIDYIQQQYQQIESWSDGTPVYRRGNTTCALESTHVDCQFIP